MYCEIGCVTIECLIAQLQGVDRVVLPFAFPFYGHPVKRDGT